MALIEWNDSLSVEVEEIDQQHKKIVELINKLHDYMKVGEGHKVLEETIKQLYHYAEVHFSTEEKYFDKFNYEHSEEHKAAHEGFKKKIKDFEEKFKEEEVSLSLDIMNFLKNWLEDHIKGSDKKYVECFHQNGLN